MNTSDLLLKLFGWMSISLVAAYLIDNVMIVGFNFPGAFSIFKHFSLLGLFEFFVYILIASITYFIVRKSNLNFRSNSIILHKLNIYLIRSFFWIILITGFVDIAIAFMRVEKIFEFFLGKEISSNFSRPVFVGMYFHVPLIILGFIIAKFTKTIGFHWLSLLIVASEL